MSLLPLREAPSLEPFDALESKAWRLAKAIEATTRRRDVRRLRSQIVLLLLALRCPRRGRPRRAWYVPGGVARVGAGGLLRSWRGYWGEDPPTLRTFRAHLGALEAAGVLLRAPGDWLPIHRDPRHLERRPRYPDSFLLLDLEAEAEWWSRRGRELLLQHPETRHNPDRWRFLFGDWRARAAAEADGLELEALRPAAPVQPVLPGFRRSGPGAAVAGGLDRRELGERLAEVVTRDRVTAGEVLGALDSGGAAVRGRNRLEVQADVHRFLGAAALLAVVLLRGDRVRNPAGWLVRAYLGAGLEDRSAALARCRRLARPGPDRPPREVLGELLGRGRASALLDSLELRPPPAR